jgi:LmbE family N-acetylglucosaminyl deacetylase
MTWRARLARVPLRVGNRLPPNVIRHINLARGIDTPLLVDRPPGRRVVVMAPHPDDEVIGVGGTLVKHLAAGDGVDVVFLTSGERTAGLAGASPADRAATREAEAAAAADVLGLPAGRLHFLRLPDGGVDESGAQALAAVLAELAPDLLYLPTPVDVHRDHRGTAALVAACLPRAPSVRHVALYEVWTTLYPSCIVDIGASVDRKIDALRQYASALTSVDYLHTAKGLAAYRSAQGLHGRGYAEAFLVLEPGPFIELVRELAV